jgi:hypothetical protein
MLHSHTMQATGTLSFPSSGAGSEAASGFCSGASSSLRSGVRSWTCLQMVHSSTLQYSSVLHTAAQQSLLEYYSLVSLFERNISHLEGAQLTEPQVPLIFSLHMRHGSGMLVSLLDGVSGGGGLSTGGF